MTTNLEETSAVELSQVQNIESNKVETRTQSRDTKKWSFAWKKTFERKDRALREKKEFEEKMLEVRAVTRVTTGGRQRSFRAIMLVGNRNGKIGLWVANGIDVAIASAKATHDAYKNMIQIDINDNWTVNYAVEKKFKAAKIKLIPAAPGTGLKAGSSVRSVLELAWFKNILSKIVGTNNKLNNAILTINALNSYKKFIKNGEYFANKTVDVSENDANLDQKSKIISKKSD